jgi:multicomponent Na+:H+ antiporter subunit D
VIAASATEKLVLLALLLPFLAALIIPLFAKHPNRREAVTLIAAGALLLTVASLLPPVLGGARPGVVIVEITSGLGLALKLEPLGMLFALVASSLWVVNSIYSIGYMRANEEPRQTSFYVCFAIAIGSTIGVAFAANLFTLFLFYEALTISTYPLVTHRQNAEAMRSGRLYLGLLLGTSMVLFLPAIIATWVIAGTLDFAPGGVLGGKVDGLTAGVLFGLYAFGIGKAALIPLHFWLPAAMVAPTPVSALLHAVAVVKAGVFAILKIAILIFGLDTLAGTGQSAWLTAVAGVTVIGASLVALRQDNLKRRLAYSTISQLSYVVLGVAILTPISAIGAAMHIAAHAFGKITLFFAAGSIHTAAHLTLVSELDGIGRRMPWTMGAFTVGTLSMIGIPPTAGFLGKWFLLGGAAETGNWLAIGVIVASTVLNATYLLPIVFRAFFREPRKGRGRRSANAAGEAPWPMVVAVTVTGAGTVLLFLLPALPFALATLMLGR